MTQCVACSGGGSTMGGRKRTYKVWDSERYRKKSTCELANHWEPFRGFESHRNEELYRIAQTFSDKQRGINKRKRYLKHDNLTAPSFRRETQTAGPRRYPLGDTSREYKSSAISDGPIASASSPFPTVKIIRRPLLAFRWISFFFE